MAHPVRESKRLAVAGRRGNQHELAGGGPVQVRRQFGTWTEVGGKRRNLDLALGNAQPPPPLLRRRQVSVLTGECHSLPQDERTTGGGSPVDVGSIAAD